MIGLHAGDEELVILEGIARRAAASALFIRVERGDQEVAVVHAAPSPVDVVEAVGIDAIEHKEVAFLLLGHTAVGHGSACFNLVDEHLLVVGSRSVVARDITSSLVVAKIFCDGGDHIHIEGPGAIGQIVALESSPDVEHELCNGVFGGIVAILVAFRGHHAPVVGRVQVGTDLFFGRGRGIGNAARGCGRVLPVVHHLCQGCGHAACGGASAHVFLLVFVIVGDIGA